MTKHTGQTSPYSDETHLVDADRARALTDEEIERACARAEAVIEECRRTLRLNQALLGQLRDALPGK